jgi:protein-L-isoaspartate(D-aspartate) O-methyltransferase
MSYFRSAVIVAILPWFSLFAWGDDYAAARRQMVAEVADGAAETAHYTGRAAFSPRVMAALGKVERHRFVPAALAPRAYLNRPLPIGEEQTISQPFIVALMTDLLDLAGGERVLEIGTGSGYQAAILSELGAQVFSVEIVPALAKTARRQLDDAGYRDVAVRIGDGWAGWPEQAPFDAIIVTAAPERIPQALLDQLRPGGRLVIPVGPAGRSQELVLAVKQPDGSVTRRRIVPVAFVPFTGDGQRDGQLPR